MEYGWNANFASTVFVYRPELPNIPTTAPEDAQCEPLVTLIGSLLAELRCKLFTTSLVAVCGLRTVKLRCKLRQERFHQGTAQAICTHLGWLTA